MSTSVVERLAEWICSVRFEDIPPRVVDAARWQLASTVASLHASVNNDAAQAVKRAALTWAQPGRCTIFPGGERLPLHDAVLVNTAWSMAQDYDDYLYMGHTGHSAVLGSWAVCEADARSTLELLEAQVVANEVGGRFGASSVLGPQNGQAWSFIHALEGAAIGAKLWRLDEAQTADALAIALYQPTFTLWPGFMGPGSKVLTAGGPTVTGLQAAAFAREGLTGARRIVEHPRKGFWASFTWAPLPQMLDGLGRAWVSDTLAYKRYPGCAYVDTTLDALFDVLAEFRAHAGRPIEARDVRRIHVEANLLSVEMDNISSEHISASEPLSPININFSIPFNVALAVIAGVHDGRTLAQAFLDEHDADIRAVAGKVELSHDWGMTLEVVRAFEGVLGRSGALATLGAGDLLEIAGGYRRQLGGKKRTPVRPSAAVKAIARALPRRSKRSGGGDVDFTRFRMVFPARVTLETTDGKRFSARQDVPWGAPGQARRFETAREKLRHELRLPEERVEQVVALIENLEHESLPALTRAVCV